MTMWIADTVESMIERRSAMRGTIALVPTMGALHEGHLSLMREARRHTDQIVVSIFVNPTQFGPGEDLDRYPRPFERDLEFCRAEGAVGIFAPSVESMYPQSAIAVEMNVPALAADLEGAHRPGHFAGVCRVVAKLFNVCRPDLAFFGRKDYQQLRVISAMVNDLNMPLRIMECDTVRDEDGLALSSRNAYLSDEQRQHALGLSKALAEAQLLVADGETDPAAVERVMRQVMEVHHVDVQYAVVRHPQTLGELDCIEPALTGGVIAMVAGHVGDVHLIDNALLGA